MNVNHDVGDRNDDSNLSDIDNTNRDKILCHSNSIGVTTYNVCNVSEPVFSFHTPENKRTTQASNSFISGNNVINCIVEEVNCSGMMNVTPIQKHLTMMIILMLMIMLSIVQEIILYDR